MDLLTFCLSLNSGLILSLLLTEILVYLGGLDKAVAVLLELDSSTFVSFEI
jgi:hypothetical protein